MDELLETDRITCCNEAFNYLLCASHEKEDLAILMKTFLTLVSTSFSETLPRKPKFENYSVNLVAE